MKISKTSWHIASEFGDEKAFELLSRAGFDAVDYGYFENDDMLCEDGYIERAREQRRLLDKYGIICGQTHAPFIFKYGDKMDMSCESYAKTVRSIEMSAILGAPHTVVHSIRVPDGVDEFEYNLQYYKSFIPVCEKCGIKISVENLFSSREERYFKGRFADADELLALLKAIDSPYFDICIDVGHSLITGRKPEDVIRGLNGHVLRSLHIHDNNSWDDQHLIAHWGNIDWDEVCRALAEIGYDGIFNSEAGFQCNDEDTVLETLKYEAKILKRLTDKIERFSAERGNV